MLYLDATREHYGLASYFTDTEYNRNLGALKRIRHNPIDPPDIITCDLILHSRGREDPDNLIAIEMKKKKHTKKHKDADRRRLKALTRTHRQARRLSRRRDHVYGYQIGLFVELDTERPSYLQEIYHRVKKSMRFAKSISYFLVSPLNELCLRSPTDEAAQRGRYSMKPEGIDVIVSLAAYLYAEIPTRRVKVGSYHSRKGRISLCLACDKA
jgi:hypothetical protein